MSMPKPKTPRGIPKEIKSQVLEIVDSYNEKNDTHFKMSFRGRFAYLSKVEKPQPMDKKPIAKMFTKALGISVKDLPVLPQGKGIETKLGRLTFRGKIDNWSFAVFKYSREFYDPEEWMFPGSGHIDGTIEGALKAGMEIYP